VKTPTARHFRLLLMAFVLLGMGPLFA